MLTGRAEPRREPSARHEPSPEEIALLGRPMPDDARRAWMVTLAITVIAAVVRMWNLGVPTDKGTPVFDEKHYVPQAWQMLRNGGVEDNYGYELIVHPPLGKQLIALGEWLFGYNGWGWRFTAAIAGVLIVLLIVRIARRLTRSTLLGAIAGVLAIADGVLHLQSRMGMLDIFQALFVVAAFGCLLADRDQVRARLAEAVRKDWIGDTPYGPKLGVRWWRFGAGVMLGLALAVKWSGAWYIIFFGPLLIAFDIAARRTAGVRRPWVGTLRRDVLPGIAAIVGVAIIVYTITWAPWFASENGTDRHLLEIQQQTGGSWAFLPDALRSWLIYQSNVLEFHVNLATPEGDPHPWESKPWTWPMGLRPMLYYWGDGAEATGCGRDECVRATMLIGTPAMWWLALPVLAWSLWRAVFRADWRYGAVLTGYFAGLLPWFLNLERQMYFFYATPMAPFLVLGLVLILGQILGSARAGYERRGTGLLAISLYVGLVVANFVWLWPVLSGDSITHGHWQAELWLPSWK